MVLSTLIGDYKQKSPYLFTQDGSFKFKITSFGFTTDFLRGKKIQKEITTLI